MVKTKTIRIKKAGGGTRLQRVQVLKSGKFKFIKNTSQARKTTSIRRATGQKKTRSATTMAKKKRSFKRSSRMGITGRQLSSGFAYGLVREPINQLAKKIPFVGGIADEFVLGGAAALIRPRVKGFVRTVATNVLAI